MIYAVEYKLPGSGQGLIILTADDHEQAQQYVADLITNYGHTYVSDPMPIVNGLTDLYRLFHRDKQAILKGIESEKF